MITWFLIPPILIAVAFYLIVPGAGAFLVRHRWRRFRRDALASTELPELQYADSRAHRRYRFFGRLEAVQGDDLIWLEANGMSVGVSLEHVPMYIIPGGGGRRTGYPDETPRVVYWHEITGLAEGTQFFVAGAVAEERGGLVFRGNGNDGPLVLVYDGPEHALLKRVVWTGRQRNEYWNHFTPIALTVGFLAELVTAMLVVGESRFAALFATVLAIVPFLPLMPPGVAGYFFYRRVWRAARRRRAIRDVEIVVGRTGAARAVGRFIWLQEAAAVLLLLAGVTANGYLVAVVLALTVFA